MTGIDAASIVFERTICDTLHFRSNPNLEFMFEDDAIDKFGGN